MTAETPKDAPPRRGKALLLGVGLDNADGHVRFTRGRNYRLFGGSQETHEVMQEVAEKVNEHCDRRGKPLADVTREELAEITAAVAPT